MKGNTVTNVTASPAAAGTPSSTPKDKKNKKGQNSSNSSSPTVAASRRTRAKSESEKKNIANSTFEKTPNNKSLLHISLLNQTGLSPLATSLSESEVSEDSASSKKKAPRTTKAKCPCNTSSEGKSWNIPCSHCGQNWHNLCANLKGPKLTQEGVDSLLPNWQCPWCYVPLFPRPKNHKSAKLESALQTTSYANQISGIVIESLEKNTSAARTKLD